MSKLPHDYDPEHLVDIDHMTWEIIANVKVFCNADRPWHRDKNGRLREKGSRRFWVGHFVKTTVMGFGQRFVRRVTMLVTDEEVANADYWLSPIWGSVLHPNHRQFSYATRRRISQDNASEAVADLLSSHSMDTLRETFSLPHDYLEAIEELKRIWLEDSNVDYYDNVWSWELNERIRDGHTAIEDANVYSGARESVNDAGQTVYLFECPCKKHYPPVVRNELLPVLDMLAEKDVREIPADTLIRAIQINRRPIHQDRERGR